MSYQVLIRRNSDGEKRWCDYPYEWTDSSFFMWTDGNWGCDCNRELDFYRAMNEDPPEHENPHICLGHGAFSVLEIDVKDGPSYFPDDERGDTCIPDSELDAVMEAAELGPGQPKSIECKPHQWQRVKPIGATGPPSDHYIVACAACGEVKTVE